MRTYFHLFLIDCETATKRIVKSPLPRLFFSFCTDDGVKIEHLRFTLEMRSKTDEERKEMKEESSKRGRSKRVRQERARNLFVPDEWARGMKFTMSVGHSKEREKRKRTSGQFVRSRCRTVNNGHASGSRICERSPLARAMNRRVTKNAR